MIAHAVVCVACRAGSIVVSFECVAGGVSGGSGGGGKKETTVSILFRITTAAIVVHVIM